MDMTADQKVIKILQTNGYKILKDTEDFTILQKGSEQVYIESRDIDLLNPFICKKRKCKICKL